MTVCWYSCSACHESWTWDLGCWLWGADVASSFTLNDAACSFELRLGWSVVPASPFLVLCWCKSSQQPSLCVVLRCRNQIFGNKHWLWHSVFQVKFLWLFMAWTNCCAANVLGISEMFWEISFLGIIWSVQALRSMLGVLCHSITRNELDVSVLAFAWDIRGTSCMLFF